MDVRIYIGAHRTAGRHIENILVQNQDLLSKQGILVVTHAMQLPAFRAVRIASEKGESDAKVAKAYLEAITKGADFKTLVIMDRVRAGSVTRPVGRAMIYPQIRVNIVRYAKLFPTDSYRLFMGIRAPATFLPSCYSDSLSHAKVETFEQFTQDTDMRKLRWSETLERIQRTFENQDTTKNQIVTWRFEDYPRMWRDVVGALTGIDNPQDLIGDAIPVNKGLTLYGCQLMYKYLQDHNPKAPGDFKKIRDAFLEKFKNEDGLDPDPIGTPEFIDAMNYAYDDDWYYIERMENVAALSARPKI